jgi:hypothetical protein
MTPLEQRYRLVLRVLPADYRAVWQEEMVATFLESMHTDDVEDAEYLAEYGRPSWSEVASVAALAIRLRIPGLRLRLGGTGAPPRNVIWGDAVRLVALVQLLVKAAWAVIGIGTMLWLSGQIPGPPVPRPQMLALHLWDRLSFLAGLVWLPVYLALVIGHRRAGQLLLEYLTGQKVTLQPQPDLLTAA